MTVFDRVLQEVDERCREQHIPMLGSEKAEFLSDLVQNAQPTLIVECGTANRLFRPLDGRRSQSCR